jgi:FemAB-related protein (PEP-CTERM system-associated)
MPGDGIVFFGNLPPNRREPTGMMSGDKTSAAVLSAQLGCRTATDADEGPWNAFVASQGGNLGHRYEWKEVIESAYGHPTHHLVCTDGDRWAGVLPLVHLKGLLTGNRLVSMPFLDQAGVLAVSAEAAAALQEAAVKLAVQVSAKGIDLRAPAPEGAGPAERSTLVLELPESPDALWKSFSPKVRNQVRKSEKEGLRTEPAGPGRLDDFYHVFAVNMRDLGSPVHSRRFMEAVFEAFAADATLYLTSDEGGRVVGGAVAIASGGMVTVPWASSLREAFFACPNHSLYWKILSDACERRFEAFDFGRSHEGSGTYRFKTQWGAEPEPLLWTSFDASGKPESRGAIKPSEHQLITRAWSVLPLWLANALGPVIRRRLSN